MASNNEKRAPNEGYAWLHLVKLKNEDEFGFEVTAMQDTGGGFRVSSVTKDGAAYRAGVATGQVVNKLQLDPLVDNVEKWKRDSMEIINRHPHQKAVRVQIISQDRLAEYAERRRKKIFKLRSAVKSRKKAINAQDNQVDGNLPPIDFDSKVVKYDLQVLFERSFSKEGAQSYHQAEEHEPERQKLGQKRPVESEESGSDAKKTPRKTKLPKVVSFVNVEDDAPHTTLLETSVRFQQVGGPLNTLSIRPGFEDILEGKDYLPDDLVEVAATRFAQFLPFDLFRVRSPHFVQTMMEKTDKKKDVNKEKASTRPLVDCYPVCRHKHWTMTAVVSEGNETVAFHFDSMGFTKGRTEKRTKQPRHLTKRSMNATVSAICDYVKKQSGSTVSAKEVCVPMQENGYDCGLHVISHIAALAKLCNNFAMSGIIRQICKVPFDSVFTRADVHSAIVHLVEESMYSTAYWGKYEVSDDLTSETFQWPCKRLHRSAGDTIGKPPSDDEQDYVPVVWYKSTVEDERWVLRKDLKVLSSSSIDTVAAMHKYSEEEELRQAYEQASRPSTFNKHVTGVPHYS